MSGPIRITVILCTYNRAQSLANALESVAASELPGPIEWEILVVDNNSSDQTREVAESFCQRYPGRFRYLFEPQPGKSHALNTGIREARGDVLAFMDDDVIVEPTWLQNLTSSLHNGEWAGSGGRILFQRNFLPPRWLSLKERFALAPLAMFDLGPEPGQLDEPPFGTNMAFRKEMFEKYGRFRTDLGPRPGSEIKSEDTEFGGRLLAAGHRLRYEPSAVVYHAVAQNRIQKGYFLNWWFGKGRSDVREFGTQPDGKHFLGIPFRLVRDAGVEAVRWAVAVDPSQGFICRLKIWCYAGQGYESYHQSRDAKRKGPEGNASFRPPADSGR